MTLTHDRWMEISPYLDEVLSVPDEDRAKWMEQFHQTNPKLAPLLEELLHEHEVIRDKGFLSGAPPGPFETSFAGQVVGAYRLISQIGEGGMGTVWLAERNDGRFERQVAIKFLRFSLGSQSGAERFKREGGILARVSNLHIAELMDAGVSANGQPYIVLEYVEGQSIEKWCDERRLDVSSRVRLFLDVLDAVAHAHANLVVHRDIKPSNVLVRRDGCVKLLDFGIAKLLADDQSGAATQLTLEGGSALTPQYAAPEQISGGAITTATDIYALGALLYLLLAGKHPTGSDSLSPLELVKAITESEPMRLSDASVAVQSRVVADSRATSPERLRSDLQGDLDNIVGKALKKEPSERYGSVNAFADDLQRFLKHEPVSARADTFLYRSRKFVRRNRTAVVLSAVALCAAAAGVTGVLIQTQRAKEQRDFAFRQARRANAIGDLNSFLLKDVAPGGKPFTVDDLLGRAEHIVAREHVGNTEKVGLLISIADHYKTEDEIEKARVVLLQAYDLSRTIQDHSVRAQASCGLGPILARTGDPGRGEALLAEGLRELPGKPEYALDRVYCLMRGREMADHNGDAQLAIDRVLKAKEELNASPLRSDVEAWRLEMDLAEANREAGRLNESIESFRESYQLTINLGRDDTETAGTLLNNWALAVEYAGEPLEAEKIFYRALQLSRDNHGDQAVDPLLLVNYARVLRELSRNEEAQGYAERGLKGATDAGDEVTTNQVLLELARIYRQAGQYSRSNAMLNQVEPRLRKNLPPGHYAFSSLASERELTALAAGDLPAATHFAKEAMQILQASIKNGKQGSQFLPALLGRQSRLEVKLGQANQAAADAAEQLSLVQKNCEPGRYSSNLGYAYLNLGSALAAQGKEGLSQAAFRNAAEHLEKTLGANHPDTQMALQSAHLFPR